MPVLRRMIVTGLGRLTQAFLIFRMGKQQKFLRFSQMIPASLHCFQCLKLFDIQTGHQPVELLPGNGLHFNAVPRPAESSLDYVQAFI